jgi:hypothetical protein
MHERFRCYQRHYTGEQSTIEEFIEEGLLKQNMARMSPLQPLGALVV